MTRILYDDIIMPLGIELKNYGNHDRMDLSRKTQVVIATISDFLTGILLLYLFYNTAMH